MKSGEKILEKDVRINNRIYILSNIENLIKESVYYRTYSEEFIQEKKATSISLNNVEMKAKLL